MIFIAIVKGSGILRLQYLLIVALRFCSVLVSINDKVEKIEQVRKVLVSECWRALAGQTGGAIRVVLEFFAPLFASGQKVEKEL
jgi:hypothetical protein